MIIPETVEAPAASQASKTSHVAANMKDDRKPGETKSSLRKLDVRVVQDKISADRNYGPFSDVNSRARGGGGGR